MKLRTSAVAAILIVLVAIMVVTVIVAWVFLRSDTIKPEDLWTGVLPVFVGVLAAVLPWLLQRGGARRQTLEEAVLERVPALKAKVVTEWKEEQVYRGLYEGKRADLRWRKAPASDPAARLAAALPDAGTLDVLTGGFARHAQTGAPTRLVVTGAAGAGKTSACVLLTLGLGDAGPLVPVMFQLTAWNPDVPLYEWMAEELLAAYPLAADEQHGRDVAAQLVRHHVLPVLDGLDEMSDPARALSRIEVETEGRSFVLSCRTEEFEAANAGHVLRQAVVVRLEPLSADEVRAYLSDHAGDGLDPVAAKLAVSPASPVAEALSTPLMLSLAVTRGGEPVRPELLDATDPGAADRIRRHLLGSLVDKVFAPKGNVKEPTSPVKARRYLEFLAGQVDESGRLAWWRLCRAVPVPVFVIVAFVVATVACSGLAAGFFTVFGRPWAGFWIGFVVGGLGSFVVSLLPQEDPQRARPRLRRAVRAYALLRTVGFGVTGGAASALIVWFQFRSPFYVVVGAVLSGLTFALARYVSEPSDPIQAVTPQSLLASDRAAVLFAWMAGGVPGALTGAYLGAALKTGHRPELATLPIMELPPAALALLGALGGGVLSAAGLGLMAHGSSSWGRFLTTRAWLAARGSTPIRLMRFLHEARERGVLRQFSGYYEFRHRLLRDYLAHPGLAIEEPEIPPEEGPDEGSATATSAGPDKAQ